MPGPSLCPYSPECVELEFSEVHIQDPEYPHSGTPKNTHPGTLHSPGPLELVTPLDTYTRSWMFFLQTNVCTSERTPHAPSLMLQVSGRGYAELLRTPSRRSSTSKKSDKRKFSYRRASAATTYLRPPDPLS